jgi:serine/threonine-protein kinase
MCAGIIHISERAVRFRPVQSGERLGRYTIQGLIGRGGMGTVYRATDPTLGRDVALKVLPADVAADPERIERFRREARALAALNHPHIVTIYSVEQDGDTHFLTMELVGGSPLDSVIAGRGQPLDRVTQVGTAVASALSAAHDKGIIHRDLKPANIIVSDSGQTKVLDFGLSKMRENISADAPSMTRLETQAGTVVGTPAYMSPEQIAGRDVDQRSDIFSLGVILYEMVTGVRPFSGRSTLEMASSVLHDTPAEASSLRATVPAELAGVIARCLEKSAASRYSSMADLHHALAASARPSSPPAGPEGPSIAVLPFTNLSADPDSEFFGDGLAEEILNALAQIDGLRVAARSSSFSFKGKDIDVGEIAARLHVATVLDGSVRRAGSRVRVTLRLIDGTSGFQSWSERYDRDMADIFDVQDEIARAVAAKLKVTLAGGASQRLAKQLTTNVEAYELYLRGRALITKRGKHVGPGMDCLKRAVELDPAFAVAWAGLADAYTVQGYWGTSPPGEVMPKGLTAARRAVALDPELGEGHCALGAALMLWERDYEGAKRAFEKGLELNPQHIQGRTWFGLFVLQWIGGRLQEGLTELRRAFEDDPLSAYAATMLGFGLTTVGDTEEGLKLTRLATERDPEALVGHWVHGLTAHLHGAFDEALAAYARACEVSSRAEYPLVHMAIAYADCGRLAEARALHDELMSKRARGHVTYLSLALTSAAVGDMDAAMEYAQQSCDEREPGLMLFARVFPNLRRLRADPRFADVLRRLALPQSGP